MSTHKIDNYLMPDVDPGLYTEANWPTLAQVDDSAFVIDTETKSAFAQELGKPLPTRGEAMLTQFPVGFVRDFVLATRGIESPTTFALWAGLFGTSCALQRRAWIWPEPHRLYPNLFLVFMAPPAINKKSTTVLRAAKILSNIPSLFDDPGDRELYALPTFEGTITPEGFFDLLEPKTTTIYEEGSTDPMEVHLGSRMALIVDELGSFLGKQKYNAGQITRLITLYDCKDKDNAYTRKDKLRPLENVFFNFFAATTPNSFSESIPGEAHGSGFLSRVVLVHEPEPVRMFPEPRTIHGASSLEELTRKLGWIARFKSGQYHLSQKAQLLYNNWYQDYRHSFQEGGINAGDEGNSRGDVMLMKIATLIRAQAYTNRREITEDDLKLAILLIGAAEDDKKDAYALIMPSDWSRRLNTVTKRLRAYPAGVSRSKLAGWVSRDCTTAQMDEVLHMLVTGHQIEVELDGELLPTSHKNGREIYRWKTSTS